MSQAYQEASRRFQATLGVFSKVLAAYKAAVEAGDLDSACDIAKVLDLYSDRIKRRAAELSAAFG